MVIQASLTDGSDEPPPVFNNEEIHDIMFSHVRDAIDDVNQEMQDGISTPCNPSHRKEGNVDRQEGESSLSEVKGRS